jgi:hypothetical protein
MSGTNFKADDNKYYQPSKHPYQMAHKYRDQEYHPTPAERERQCKAQTVGCERFREKRVPTMTSRL